MDRTQPFAAYCAGGLIHSDRETLLALDSREINSAQIELNAVRREGIIPRRCEGRRHCQDCSKRRYANLHHHLLRLFGPSPFGDWFTSN
jgi:hypothetical protein